MFWERLNCSEYNNNFLMKESLQKQQLETHSNESHFNLGNAPSKNSFGKMSDHYFKEHIGAKQIDIGQD